MKNLSIFTNESEQKKIQPNKLFASRFLEKTKSKKKSESQYFADWLAENLDQKNNYSLLVKLAKTQDRILLQRAISFVKDYPGASSKFALFLWFLKDQIKPEEKKIIDRFRQMVWIKAPRKKAVKKETKIIHPAKIKPLIEIDKKEYKVEEPDIRSNIINENLKKYGEVKMDYLIDIYRYDLFVPKIKTAIDFIPKKLSPSAKLYFEIKFSTIKQKNLNYVRVEVGN